MSAASATVPKADRRRWFALVVVCLAMLMASLDATVVNVALPRIQRDLHFSQSGLAWVIDAYMISFAGLLLLSGRLGDLIGRKKVFVVGLVIFTVASVICGLAHDQGILIAGRFAQGVGVALSSSVILAIIATEFPNPHERAKAMSAYIFVAVGGGSIGLLAGGAITEAISWHWIFFINVPIGIAAVALGLWLVEENEGIGIRQGVDVAGSILITAGLAVAVYAVVQATSYGWGSVHTLGLLGLAIVLVAIFATLQARLPNPIMPLRIFAAPGLSSSNAVRVCLFSGMYGCFFIGPLYLEHVLGYGALHTGLAFLPMTLSVAMLSMGLTARLVQRIGAKQTVLPALALAAAGLLLLSQAGQHASYFPELFLAFVLTGAGTGAASIPLLTLAMSNVPARDAGLASGIVNVSLQMAGAVGIAILDTIATSHTKSLSAHGSSPVSALLGGYHLALEVAGAIVLASVLVAGVLIRQPRAQPAEIRPPSSARGR